MLKRIGRRHRCVRRKMLPAVLLRLLMMEEHRLRMLHQRQRRLLVWSKRVVSTKGRQPRGFVVAEDLVGEPKESSIEFVSRVSHSTLTIHGPAPGRRAEERGLGLVARVGHDALHVRHARSSRVDLALPDRRNHLGKGSGGKFTWCVVLLQARGVQGFQKTSLRTPFRAGRAGGGLPAQLLMQRRRGVPRSGCGRRSGDPGAEVYPEVHKDRAFRLSRVLSRRLGDRCNRLRRYGRIVRLR